MNLTVLAEKVEGFPCKINNCILLGKGCKNDRLFLNNVVGVPCSKITSFCTNARQKNQQIPNTFVMFRVRKISHVPCKNV